jgi:hypothetical protein
MMLTRAGPTLVTWLACCPVLVACHLDVSIGADRIAPGPGSGSGGTAGAGGQGATDEYGWAPELCPPRSGWIPTASRGINFTHAIDEDRNGTWWTTYDVGQAGDWFQLDLGATAIVGSVIMYTGVTADWPQSYLVELSEDGAAWTEVGRGVGVQASVMTFPARRARYIRVTYLEGRGGFPWSISDMMVSCSSVEGVVGPTIVRGTGDGDGLLGHYYSGTDLGNAGGLPVLTRVDPVLDFLWFDASPAEGVVPNDQFSVRWTGWLEPELSGDYTLLADVDDGIRLWVDQALLIDDWRMDWALRTASTAAYLEQGQRYEIVVEMFEQDAYSAIRVLWESEAVPRQVIPQGALHSAP